MVNFLDTDLGTLTKNAKILNDKGAWIYSMDIKIQDEIIYLIQKKQLFDEGIDATGEVIGIYKPYTEQLNPLKRAGTHYTLLDTGDFYKSMFIEVMEDSFIVNANGQKGRDNLFAKFGDEIIGLTDENKEVLSELLLEKYINYVREILEV
jgi:hypothetical protein